MGEHFVCIHGAWHGGWCWDGVVAELSSAGHSAEAPTLPGHHPEHDRSGIRFVDYVSSIVSQLAEQSDPIILVGHSSAGFLLQAAVPKAVDRIKGLIFLNAFILPDGRCQFDLVPPEVSEGMRSAAEASADNCVPVDEGFVRHVLMEGEPDEKKEALIRRLVPQPIALLTTPVDTKPFDRLIVPKAVLFQAVQSAFSH